MNNDKSKSQEEEFILEWMLLGSEEQDAFLEKSINENPHLAQRYKDAIARAGSVKMNRDRLTGNEKDSIFSGIVRNIERRQKKHRIIIGYSSIAAVLLIGFFSYFYLKLFVPDQPDTQPEIAVVIPDSVYSEKEVIIISGQQKTSIANNSDIEITRNARVVVVDSTELKKELTLDETTLNSLIVPFGRRSRMTLADGTRLWLNAGTRVDFPSRFTGSKREIFVSGEIYLEVSSDSLKPFFVNTDKLSVRVLGTAFNITAYSGDPIQTVVLVEGNIIVESPGSTSELLPGEKIDINNIAADKEIVDVGPYISWTRGILEFINTPVPEILKKIGRYYNVSFEAGTGLIPDDKTWSGKLFLSDNLDNVMMSVTTVLSIGYYKVNDIIYLTEK